ncbi:hypothetical protein X975_16725, partial [Stegodyphus mimosarum]
MNSSQVNIIAPADPTYHPAHPNYQAYVLDILITYNIPQFHLIIACDLHSDHLPVIFILHGLQHYLPPTATKTNWEDFNYIINNCINTRINLSNHEEVETAENFLSSKIQDAISKATYINHFPNPVDNIIQNTVGNFINSNSSTENDHTSPIEVQDFIRKLNPKKASGYDITSKLRLKIYSLIIETYQLTFQKLESLHLIFSSSIRFTHPPRN